MLEQVVAPALGIAGDVAGDVVQVLDPVVEQVAAPVADILGGPLASLLGLGSDGGAPIIVAAMVASSGSIDFEAGPTAGSLPLDDLFSAGGYSDYNLTLQADASVGANAASGGILPAIDIAAELSALTGNGPTESEPAPRATPITSGCQVSSETPVCTGWAYDDRHRQLRPSPAPGGALRRRLRRTSQPGFWCSSARTQRARRWRDRLARGSNGGAARAHPGVARDRAPHLHRRRHFLGLRQSADADDADLSVPDFRSRADQPQPRHAGHAVAAGARLHPGPLAARHAAPPGAGPAGDQDGDHPRRPGAGQHRHHRRRPATAATSCRCAACTRCAASSRARPC